jgi:hypothetical protein
MVESPTYPTPNATAPREPIGGEAGPEPPIARRIERLPVEIGVLLMAAGTTTGMLPPPPGPFDLTIIASGGLIFWPRAFRVIDRWIQRRFPCVHRAAMGFLGRYLDDLERRYPESLGCQPSFNQTTPTDR